MLMLYSRLPPITLLGKVTAIFQPLQWEEYQYNRKRSRGKKRGSKRAEGLVVGVGVGVGKTLV